jgi:hypothetical protein
MTITIEYDISEGLFFSLFDDQTFWGKDESAVLFEIAKYLNTDFLLEL